MSKKNLASFAIVLIFILVSYHFFNSQGPSLRKIEYVKLAGVVIKVELAKTPAEQELGLSARQDLAENEGMLFIFAESRQHPFWMKDMKFPIDIIWLNENMSIVYIKKDARPESYPKIYSHDKDSKYVLEVVSGFAEKHALKIGDKIEFIH